MTRFIRLCISVLVLASIMGCQEDNTNASSEPNAAQEALSTPAPVDAVAKPTLQAPAEGEARAAYVIEGLHCGGCVAGVKNRISAVAGVSAVSCDLESGETLINFDPSKTSIAALGEAAVAGTDYAIKPLMP